MKQPYDAAGVDHILIGAASLDDGIRAFESATGVTPVRGGRHPSRGTAVVGWAVHVVDAADAAARLSQAGFKATGHRFIQLRALLSHLHGVTLPEFGKEIVTFARRPEVSQTARKRPCSGYGRSGELVQVTEIALEDLGGHLITAGHQ